MSKARALPDHDSVLELIAETRLGPAETVDYYAVELTGYSQPEWAQLRGVTQQAISGNIVRARETLACESSERFGRGDAPWRAID